MTIVNPSNQLLVSGHGDAMTQDAYAVTPADRLVPAPDAPPAHTLGAGATLPPDAIRSYKTDGVVCLRSILDAGHVAQLREAADASAREPGPLGYRIGEPGRPGFFYYDFQLHERHEAFDWFVNDSGVPKLAAELMGSPGITLYYSNLFVKDGGSEIASPWHEDASYQRIDGDQCLNFWVALDTIPAATTLIFLRGSHRRGGPVHAPHHFDPDGGYDTALSWNRAPAPPPDNFLAVHDPIWWALEPGDALVFNHRTLHGAPVNSLPSRRRAAALLLFGDDASYNADPGTSDPPFRDDSKTHGDHPAGEVFPRLI